MSNRVTCGAESCRTLGQASFNKARDRRCWREGKSNLLGGNLLAVESRSLSPDPGVLSKGMFSVTLVLSY